MYTFNVKYVYLLFSRFGDTFALALAVQVCARGSNCVGQRHERHLLHTCQAWQTGMKEVTGQDLGMLWAEVCWTVLGQVNDLHVKNKTIRNINHI